MNYKKLSKIADAEGSKLALLDERNDTAFIESVKKWKHDELAKLGEEIGGKPSNWGPSNSLTLEAIGGGFSSDAKDRVEQFASALKEDIVSEAKKNNQTVKAGTWIYHEPEDGSWHDEVWEIVFWAELTGKDAVLNRAIDFVKSYTVLDESDINEYKKDKKRYLDEHQEDIELELYQNGDEDYSEASAHREARAARKKIERVMEALVKGEITLEDLD